MPDRGVRQDRGQGCVEKKTAHREKLQTGEGEKLRILRDMVGASRVYFPVRRGGGCHGRGKTTFGTLFRCEPGAKKNGVHSKNPTDSPPENGSFC